MPKKKRSSSKTKKSEGPQMPALGSKEAQDAFKAGIGALSQWREDVARTADKNASKVYGELASAAEAMGWPEEVVEGIRAQLDKTTELQLHMIDQAMDAWVQQVKSPMATPPGLESFTSQVPILQNPLFDLGKTSSGRPDIDPMAAMMNPMQAWVQTAEFWQNAWLQAFKGWSDMQRSAITSSSSLGRYRSH
jgi:hypothetical protein